MELKCVLLTLVLLHCGVASNQAHVKYQWKTPGFVFPNDSVEQSMISSGKYIPGNSIILDVDVGHGGSEQVFVSLPRFQNGTPATLCVVSTKSNQSADPTSPLLEPYPDWSWHLKDDCSGLTSVFRVQVDSCNRLWVVDSGVTEIFSGPKHVCPPQIVVFSLETNEMIRRYRIPPENLKNDSLLINIAVDVRPVGSDCRNTFAYVADVLGHALIVYDAIRGESWRVQSELFGPDPSAEHFTIAGESFNLTDGVLGLALSPVKDGDRQLYFHSLASVRESRVTTSILRNKSLFVNVSEANESIFEVSSDTRPSQTAATAMDRDAVLFFNLVSSNSLDCWNSRLPYTSQNLVQLLRDDNALQFASGMKVVSGRSGEETVWALSCRFQRLMTGSFNTSEVNFRVVTAPVAQMVKGTSCDVRLG